MRRFLHFRVDAVRALLAVGLCACSALPGAAMAQNFTVSVTNAPALQEIVTGTTSTTFTVSNAGAVSVSPTSTTAAVRVKSGSVTAPSLTVTCARQGSSSGKDCRSSSLTVRVTEGTASGGSTVGAITCATGQAQPAGVTYTCTTGGTGSTAYREFVYTYGSGANTAGWTSTIKLGLTLVVPVNATRGATSVPAVCTRVTGANDSFSTGGCSTLVTAKLLRAITVSKTSDLRFGTLMRGSGGVALSPAGIRTATGTASFAPGSTASVAAFDITGEGGQAIGVTVPATFALSNGTNTLTVTTIDDLPGGTSAQTLGSSIGTDATLSLRVGGSLPLTSSTPSGTYTGSFTVTASYQ
jgi:hypothetical protein